MSLKKKGWIAADLFTSFTGAQGYRSDARHHETCDWEGLDGTERIWAISLFRSGTWFSGHGGRDRIGRTVMWE